MVEFFFICNCIFPSTFLTILFHFANYIADHNFQWFTKNVYLFMINHKTSLHDTLFFIDFLKLFIGGHFLQLEDLNFSINYVR